jgi:hypothetical protein
MRISLIAFFTISFLAASVTSAGVRYEIKEGKGVLKLPRMRRASATMIILLMKCFCGLCNKWLFCLPLSVAEFLLMFDMDSKSDVVVGILNAAASFFVFYSDCVANSRFNDACGKFGQAHVAHISAACDADRAAATADYLRKQYIKTTNLVNTRVVRDGVCSPYNAQLLKEYDNHVKSGVQKADRAAADATNTKILRDVADTEFTSASAARSFYSNIALYCSVIMCYATLYCLYRTIKLSYYVVIYHKSGLFTVKVPNAEMIRDDVAMQEFVTQEIARREGV